jgi:hypothetical protein
MTLQIHPVAEVHTSDLRRLIIDNLGALLGEGARLVDNMPHIDGCCLAASDGHDRPLLLSFHAADAQRALLTGLAWMDKLDSETARLFLQDNHLPGGLLVLAPAAPPGLTLFRGACPVSWQRIQVLSVNGELGLVIAPLVEETTSAAPIRAERRPTIVESVLSPEEERHFSQL